MSENVNVNESQLTASRLREWLTAVVPTDKLVVETLFAALEELRRDLLPVSGQPLGGVLTDPRADLGVLVKIKDHGKRLAARADLPQADRDTALTIYFAAIASALAHHHQKISTHSRETLGRSFELLAEKAWLTPELAGLFRQAAQVCAPQR